MGITSATCDACGKTLRRTRKNKPLKLAITKTGKILCRKCALALPTELILAWR